MRLALILGVACLLAGPAAADVRLFRPLTADPRENQSRWRICDYTEDWRYGTDIGDSTSQGGVLPGQRGVAWEIAGGEVFRWQPLRRLGGWRGPWVRYQLGVAAGMFSAFDSGALMNTDYQFGVSFDALWSGAFDDARGIADFDRPVVTSRVMLLHRSSHLGDEYLALGRFADNQDGAAVGHPRLAWPPVKRVDLSYESVHAILSIERAGGDGAATLRAYGGAEFKLRLPERWKIGGLIPRNFTSPAARLGLEYRSAGDAADPIDGPVVRAINRLVGQPRYEAEWIAAVDARIARPYNFAAGDNPEGGSEAWTPHLWTTCPHGREFENYATSWRALVGLALSPRARRAAVAGGSRVAPEWVVALEWYRGYSFNGQFLDQRLRYRPRWYVVPSVTVHL